jgi:RND family efflux transporter MFP subunit
MNLSPRLSVVSLAILALAVGACQKPPERVAPAPPKVNVAHPKTVNYVESDTYNGWIDAVETVQVRSRVRGHIYKVDFTDGQMVKKDQVLFELDPRPFEADVGRVQEQLKVYQAQLVAAQKEAARLQDLQSKGGSSQSQVDKAVADVGSLQAQIEATKQEITSQELNLEYSKVTAPIAGRVGKAEMTVGNLVNAGGSEPVLTTIVSVDPVYVYFSVDERSMLRYMERRKATTGPRTGDLKASQLPFVFALESETGFPHDGKIDFVDNQVDKTTGTILARGAVPNPNGLFVAGARARIGLPIADARQVTVVPDTAILSDQDKRYVLVLNDKNIVQRRDIAPGRLLDDGMRIVLANEKGPVLSPNDWIIVQGLQSARLNYPVEPVKPNGVAAIGGPSTQTAVAATQH